MKLKKNPNDLRYNPTMKDAGMATSAAPTYFPEHKIVVGYQKKTCQSVTNAVITVDVPIEEIYSDGGIQCNNPAALAYDFSLKQAIEPEKIKIWSIGTGDCIRSSFNQSAYQGQYFWAKNLQHFLGAQQNDVDTYLDTSLGDRYHRFQFWMDHEQIIPLDDFRPETVEYLLNAGHEVVEENADKINKLVEDAKNRFEL